MKENSKMSTKHLLLSKIDQEKQKIHHDIRFSLEHLVDVPIAENEPSYECLNFGEYELLRFPALTGSEGKPLLLCFALVNSPKILYMNKQGSLVSHLQAEGFDVFVVKWRDVRAKALEANTSYYVKRVVLEALRYLTCHYQQMIHLAGVCQGGVLTAMAAALQPDLVASLTFFVTPGNGQHPDDHMQRIAQRLKPWLESFPSPYIEHDWVAKFFLGLKPVGLQFRKYARLSEHRDLSFFKSMERWIYHGPAVSTLFLREYIESCYYRNAFYSDTLLLDGQDINLSNIKCPILNIVAERDHIVHPSSSRSVSLIFKNNLCHELLLETGHIGLFVNQKHLKRITSFMSTNLRT